MEENDSGLSDLVLIVTAVVAIAAATFFAYKVVVGYIGAFFN